MKKGQAKSEVRTRALTNKDYNIPDPTEEEVREEENMQNQIEDLWQLIEHNRQLAIEAKQEREEHLRRVAET